MKTMKSKWLVGSMAAGMLALGSQMATAGIAGSQHDFTPSGNAQNGTASSSAEICAFCHTPHASDTSFVGAPLWNKSYNGDAANDFTRYSALGTSTIDGAEANVGSVSLACLSCHDGSQAMDVVVNAPGQDLGGGSYDPDNQIGAMTSAGINSLALIGTDLRNDHPVSIEYGGGASAAWPADSSTNAGDTFCGAGECGDPDFNAVTAAKKNGTVTWFFDDNGNSRVDKEEIRLYGRSDVGGNDVPYVECGSCHDPHNTKDNYGGGPNTNVSDTDGTLATQVDFLRQSNADSAICLTCHDK